MNKNDAIEDKCMCVLSRSVVSDCDRMDCSLPGSSVHGIFQARILEWVAISSFRESSQPRYRTHGSYIGRWILLWLSHLGSPNLNHKHLLKNENEKRSQALFPYFFEYSTFIQFSISWCPCFFMKVIFIFKEERFQYQWDLEDTNSSTS